MAANSSLGVKNNRMRVLSPVISNNAKETNMRYPVQNKRFEIKSTLNVPSSIKLLPARETVTSPLRNQARR